MKKRDRENLEFLLNASSEVIEDWYNQMDDDDIEYACELLSLAQAELDQRILALQFAEQNVIVAPLTNTVH